MYSYTEIMIKDLGFFGQCQFNIGKAANAIGFRGNLNANPLSLPNLFLREKEQKDRKFAGKR